jgi:hypothetical protein
MDFTVLCDCIRLPAAQIDPIEMDNAQVPKQPKSPLKIMENESEPENRHMYLGSSLFETRQS